MDGGWHHAFMSPLDLPCPPTPLTLGYGEHLHQYKRNVRAAVMSAREKAPSLLPQVREWREGGKGGGGIHLQR